MWRGHSARFGLHRGLDTGHEALNQRLLQQGWPAGVWWRCARKMPAGWGEWLLFGLALGRVAEDQIVLLNPQTLPFTQGLAQAGENVDRLRVVQV